MEWSKQQQVILLLQSCGLGFFLGMLFDVFNIPIKMCPRRRWLVLLSDVLFCVFASLITFYFSLAMMDGRMHPLLFGGILIGFCTQHISLGRFASIWLYRACRFIWRSTCVLFRLIQYPFDRLFGYLSTVITKLHRKKAKKVRKRRKISMFFRKKS